MSTATEDRESLAEYHSGADGRITSSRLRLFKRSVAVYAATWITKRMPAEKPESKFSIGTASHTLLLEPERFAATVKVIPKEKLASNGAKSTNAFKDFAAEHAGCVLLKQQEYDAVCWMAEEVLREAETLIKLPGRIETTGYWTDPLSGLPCKYRPDKACACGIIVDLKSMADVSEYGFIKSCANFRYDDQGSFYQDGYEEERGQRPDLIFLCYEKEPPFRVKLYEFSPDSDDLAESRANNHAALADLKRRQDTGDWSEPGQGEIIPIRLPPWAKRRGNNFSAEN